MKKWPFLLADKSIRITRKVDRMLLSLFTVFLFWNTHFRIQDLGLGLGEEQDTNEGHGHKQYNHSPNHVLNYYAYAHSHTSSSSITNPIHNYYNLNHNPDQSNHGTHSRTFLHTFKDNNNLNDNDNNGVMQNESSSSHYLPSSSSSSSLPSDKTSQYLKKRLNFRIRKPRNYHYHYNPRNIRRLNRRHDTLCSSLPKHQQLNLDPHHVHDMHHPTIAMDFKPLSSHFNSSFLMRQTRGGGAAAASSAVDAEKRRTKSKISHDLMDSDISDSDTYYDDNDDNIDNNGTLQNFDNLSKTTFVSTHQQRREDKHNNYDYDIDDNFISCQHDDYENNETVFMRPYSHHHHHHHDRTYPLPEKNSITTSSTTTSSSSSSSVFSPMDDDSSDTTFSALSSSSTTSLSPYTPSQPSSQTKHFNSQREQYPHTPKEEEEGRKRGGGNPVVYRYFARSRARSKKFADSIPFIILGSNVDHFKMVGKLLSSRGFNVMACNRVRRNTSTILAPSSTASNTATSSNNDGNGEGEAFVNAILDALKWNQAILVACDDDAVLAVEAALRLAPHRIAGLVLCGDLTKVQMYVKEQLKSIQSYNAIHDNDNEDNENYSDLDENDNLNRKVNNDILNEKSFIKNWNNNNGGSAGNTVFDSLVIDSFLQDYLLCPFTIIWDGDTSVFPSLSTGSMTSSSSSIGASSTLSSNTLSNNYLFENDGQRSVIVGGGSSPHRRLPEQFAWVLTRFVEKQVSSTTSPSASGVTNLEDDEYLLEARESENDDDEHNEELNDYEHVQDDASTDAEDASLELLDENSNVNSTHILVRNRLARIWKHYIPSEIRYFLEGIFSPGSLLVSGRAIATAVIYLSLARVCVFQYQNIRTIQSACLKFEFWQLQIGKLLSRISGTAATSGLLSSLPLSFRRISSESDNSDIDISVNNVLPGVEEEIIQNDPNNSIGKGQEDVDSLVEKDLDSDSSSEDKNKNNEPLKKNNFFFVLDQVFS